MAENGKKGKTLIVFSNDLDRVMASLQIALGAAAMGFPVSMFFTFWGLSVLRKPAGGAQNKTFLGRLFGLMLPKGAARLKLSKMHMGGAGTWMMKLVMKQQKVVMAADLLESAQSMGVQFIACQMSMDVMGIKREELIDDIAIGGVARYLEAAEEANVNLFI